MVFLVDFSKMLFFMFLFFDTLRFLRFLLIGEMFSFKLLPISSLEFFKNHDTTKIIRNWILEYILRSLRIVPVSALEILKVSILLNQPYAFQQVFRAYDQVQSFCTPFYMCILKIVISDIQMHALKSNFQKDSQFQQTKSFNLPLILGQWNSQVLNPSNPKKI